MAAVGLPIGLLGGLCSALAWRLPATRCHSAGHGPPVAPRVVVSGPCASTTALNAPWHPGHLARPKSRRNTWKRPTGPGRPHLAKARGETSATLPAAGRPLARSISDPLMALGGWVGTLVPRDRPHRGRPLAEDANARNPAAGAKKRNKIQKHPVQPTAERADTQTLSGHRPGCARQAARALRGESAA